MILVDSYAQNYRWSMVEILDLTLPQIYMLNGAAHANRQRLDKKMKVHSDRHSLPIMSPDEIVWNGKPLDRLNSQEYMAYVAAGQQGF